MATYIPNATQTTEPVESRTVESAALEFRTLKASVNSRVATVQSKLDAETAARIAGDANLQAQNNAQDVRLTAIENALPFIGEGSLPGTVYVQRLSGTGAQTVFTLNAAPQSNNVVDIYISGIYQNKDTFTVSGTTLTFSKAPPAGTNNIEVQVTVTIALGETDASLVTYGGTTVAAQLDAIPANFVQVTGNQTIGGVKTFSSPPVVPNDSFSFAQLQNIPTGTILGRASADTGDVEALTGAQATALLSAASETVRGLVELADAAEAQALASAVVALTPARLADAFKGANQSLNSTGYQKLPGGLIVQWGTNTIPAGTANNPVTLPIAFPNSFRSVTLGVSLTVVTPFDAPGYSKKTLTGFSITNPYTGSEVVVDWLAVGH